MVKSKKAIFLLILVIILGIAIFLYWEDNALMITDISYKNTKIPSEFNGYRIVQISDLHNKAFGTKQAGLLKATAQAKPDLIVITGDFIDARRTDLPVAMAYAKGAVKIAPVYFISGNHEADSGIYYKVKAALTEAGVVVLDNKKVELAKNGQSLKLIGIADPLFDTKNYSLAYNKYSFNERLKYLTQNDHDFKILLTHRCEYIDLYKESGVNLVLAGHAHGGQFRLPLVGPVYAPGQGLFPKYTSGLYTEGNTSMVVSRGLGNSQMPIRLFNRPEIVVTTLYK